MSAAAKTLPTLKSENGGDNLPAAIPAAACELEPLVRRWILRIMIVLGGHRKFIAKHGLSDDGLAWALGLGHWVEPEDEYDAQSARSDLRRSYARRMGALEKAQAPACLRRNIESLSKLIGLSEIDARILEFAVLIHGDPMLDEAGNLLDDIPAGKLSRTLSRILDLPEADIRAALSGKNLLQQSGLLRIDHSHRAPGLQGKLDLISGDFPDKMLSPDPDPLELLSDSVAPSAPPTLALQDYSHIHEELTALRSFLHAAIAEKQEGVNLFVYGAPGTGKTQLARILARDARCGLYDVASSDNDGDPITGERRMRALRAAQYFFAKGRNMLLFDEAEDVFAGGRISIGGMQFGEPSPAQSHKAWVNRMLEENKAPTIWLSNSSGGIDPAFIRRFKMIVELKVPPARKRRQIIRRECCGLLTTAHIDRLADAPGLAPAVVTQAASVARSIRHDLGKDGAAKAFDAIVNKTLEIQGHQPLRPHDPDCLPETYDPAFINADSEPRELADGLLKARAGRLCLYGPPGTGKTAYARWLARRMDMPLMVKRGSDLLSMWVGGSEKNIADAFAETAREQGVLLLDEIDSFLRDRRHARRSWEVTQVNEMLTQMESFAGIFIASTNLADGLDQASLRRFDLKMKFDYMRPEQSWLLFQKHCEQLALPIADPADLEREIRLLQNLTPGDFAAVARRHRFHPLATPAEFLRALAQECDLKQASGRRIGFV